MDPKISCSAVSTSTVENTFIHYFKTKEVVNVKLLMETSHTAALFVVLCRVTLLYMWFNLNALIVESM